MKKYVFLLLVVSTAVGFFRSNEVSSALTSDSWSGVVDMFGATGLPVAAIHSTLLPDGKLLIVGAEGLPSMKSHTAIFTPTPIGQQVPASLTVPNLTVPYIYPFAQRSGDWTYFDTIFCGGASLMADGSVFFAGGSRYLQNDVEYPLRNFIFGLPHGMVLNHSNRVWTRTSTMVGTGEQLSSARWYPSVTRLSDGRMLTVAGSEAVDIALDPGNQSVTYYKNRSVELYNPATRAWTRLSTHANSPEAIWNRDYTHVFQLPAKIRGFDLLMLGEYGVPVLFAPAAVNKWSVSNQLRPDSAPGDIPNYGASTAILPLRLNDGEWGYSNGSVVTAGGLLNSTHQRSIDIYDPVADVWKPRIDMVTKRGYPSLIILPDGRILILAGSDHFGVDASDSHESNPDLGYANYLDPATGFTLARGEEAMPEVRGYHSVATLLPDGRIFVASGVTGHGGLNELGSEKPSFRYYYPDYMNKPRPILHAVYPGSSPGTTVKLGASFWIISESASPIAEVVLVGLGSMTHSFDQNQRYVQLRTLATQPVPGYPNTVNGIQVQAPSTSMLAPPGHYMLFVLDANRVPSVAKIVKLIP